MQKSSSGHYKLVVTTTLLFFAIYTFYGLVDYCNTIKIQQHKLTFTMPVQFLNGYFKGMYAGFYQVLVVELMRNFKFLLKML